jgi:hypothetical protein
MEYERPVKQPVESVAVMEKLADCVVVGVPLSIPVLLFRLRPAGRLPLVMEKVCGPVPPSAEI